MSTFMLRIVTPDKMFFTGEVENLIIMSVDGEIGILPGHISMVVALESSPIRMKYNGAWKHAALSGGFAQIKGHEVNILADSAEWPEDIEVNRAIEAMKRAEERIQAHKSDLEYMRSQVALKRSLARLHVAKGE